MAPALMPSSGFNRGRRHSLPSPRPLLLLLPLATTALGLHSSKCSLTPPPSWGHPLPGQIGTSHLLRNYYSPGPLPGSGVLCACPLLLDTSMLLMLGCRCPPRQAHRCLWWVLYPPWSCHTPFSPFTPLSPRPSVASAFSIPDLHELCSLLPALPPQPSPALGFSCPVVFPWVAVKCYTWSSLGPGPCGSAFHP